MNTTNKKILIVDDDKFLINMYSIKFKGAGFEVNTCSSTEEALNQLKDGFKPDVFLLDIILPGMDGLEFVQTIQKENLVPTGAKIVMLTNQSDGDEIERAKALKVDGYIVKATTIPSEIVEEVTKIMSNSDAK